jgi:hypothetical protein
MASGHSGRCGQILKAFRGAVAGNTKHASRLLWPLVDAPLVIFGISDRG